MAHAIRTIILLAPGEDTGEAGIRLTDTAPYNLITILPLSYYRLGFRKSRYVSQEVAIPQDHLEKQGNNINSILRYFTAQFRLRGTWERVREDD